MGLKYQIARILRDAPFAGHVRYTNVTPETTIVTLVNLTNASLTVAAQPTHPQNMIVIVVDTSGSITVGTVTITGKSAHGSVQVETFDCAAGAGSYVGSKAFATVTTVVTSGFSVLGGAGDETIHVHSGYKVGLPCANLKAVYKACVNDANEAVGTVNTTYGTIIPTTAINTTNDYDFWFTYYGAPEAY